MEMAKPFTLEITYRTKGDAAFVWGDPDAEIEELVGIRSDGSGTSTETGDRDLTFSFANDDEARDAFVRVKGKLDMMGKIFDHSGPGDLPDMHVL